MFDPIEEAVEEIRKGEFVVVLDDEDRENEGDLIIAADKITSRQMAWFIKHSSGFICISLTPTRISELDIPMMVPNNTEKHKTAYTVTVDYKHGTTTGISAHDRALTSRMLADQSKGAKPEDFTRPGHLNPLRYTEGGVRVRMGHTEASVGELAVPKPTPKSHAYFPLFFHNPSPSCSLHRIAVEKMSLRSQTPRSWKGTPSSFPIVTLTSISPLFFSLVSLYSQRKDLCIAAGLAPAALLCELVDPDDEEGGIASRDACLKFAKQHGLKVISIEELKRWREEREGPLQLAVGGLASS
ncbi:3,4-dihydroxy-2-butanone 4-phosphate synthase [Violaceomyces palustris]|uniref:3,4-dihydroxy-2-butanone 4-phosphate synthase n=1 Tax=Violaceomyces palustris TaxID=1673888 RepID=A0ACD0NQB6_9BASI|nr:3,4-dihydroxy-2-butanone 4-phosphate synthase [Violaceomyces palustris]